MLKGSAGPSSVAALIAPVTEEATIELLVEDAALVGDSGGFDPSPCLEDEPRRFTPGEKAKGVCRFIHVLSL